MIFLDVETTDLLKATACSLNLQPHIIELYAVKLDDDFNLIAELETFLRPPIPIPHHITKINGITDETVSKAPTFARFCGQLTDFFLGERTVIGHNLSFDLGLIWVELARLGLEFYFPWPPERVCTVEKSFSIEGRRLTLTNLFEHATGMPHPDKHHAKSDVIATAICYKWMKEKGLV